MPCISQFFGIAIYLYYNEHYPPHFHAEYGGKEALYEIETLKVYAGKLSPRAHKLVREWAKLHRNELMNEWKHVRQGMQPKNIEPLE
ncbi:MAG: DUF4160 domain-containing protein [Bacteroidota bacterium]